MSMRQEARILKLESRIKQKKGFTLIELIIYMALFSILIVIITNIFSSILDVQLESKSTSSIEQDANYLMAKFIYDIGNTTAITTPSSPGTSSSTLQITTNAINYTYGLSSTNLVVTDASGSNQLNGYDTNISNLSFKRLGKNANNDSIQVTFTIASKIQRNGGNESKSFQFTVTPRQ